MSTCSELYCAVRFIGKAYRHRDEVERDIEENENCIKMIKNRLSRLAFMTEPQKFYPENTLGAVEEEIDACLRDLDDYYDDLIKLRMLDCNWDLCHNKEHLAIEPPEKYKDKAFYYGDWIPTDKNPNGD